MLPTVFDLLNGISRTINNTAAPLVMNSGDNEAVFETMAAGRLLMFIEERLDTAITAILAERFGAVPSYETCRFCDYTELCDAREHDPR